MPSFQTVITEKYTKCENKLERELIANNTTKYTLTLQLIFSGKILKSLFPLNVFSCWQPSKQARSVFTLTPDAYSEWTNGSDINILSLKDIVIDHHNSCSTWGKAKKKNHTNFKYVM